MSKSCIFTTKKMGETMHDILTIPAQTMLSAPIMHTIDKACMCTIIAEEGASATLYIDIEVPELMMNVQLLSSAHLHIVCMQKHNGVTRIVQQSSLETSANIHWHNISLGAKVEQRIQSEIMGDNAESTIDWVFKTSKTDHQDIKAHNIFSGRNGRGEITLKGIAEQSANVCCRGIIEIGEHGTGTDTYLTEDVLMLDATAKVDAIPALEIRTNDVKASHSATISRVTEEDLFYFQSRGIDQGKARQMYVDGFTKTLIEKIPSIELQEKILEILEQHHN